MSSDLRSLDRTLLPFAESLVMAIQAAGYAVTVTSTRRSRTTQARLYRNWISGKSRFPAAKPGTSIHEHGLAFDLIIPTLHRKNPDAENAVLDAAGRLWESWGGRWGGRFRDPIHFEARPGDVLEVR